MIAKTPSADQTITPSADHVALIVKQGGSLFISNLFEARDSSNNIKFYVDKGGNINAQGISVAGSALAASHLSNGTTGTAGTAVVLATSPALAGNPTAPTQTAGNSSTRIATTAFVAAAVAAITVPVTTVFGRTGAVVAATNDYTDLQIQNSPTNKLTTTGDILYASAANTLARRAIGTTADALRVVAGVPQWKTLAMSSGGLGSYSLDTNSFSSGQTGMLGMALSITPTCTGKVTVVIASAAAGGWINVAANFGLCIGTGSAPANGAAIAGTAISTVWEQTGYIGTGSGSACLVGSITGLTPGTTYWVDAYMTFVGAPQGDQNPGLYGGSYIITEVG